MSGMYPLCRMPAEKCEVGFIVDTVMDHLQQRKFRRFALSYPVHVQFPAGESIAEVDAVSRNVSMCGLLLESPRSIPQGSSLDFTITVGGPIPRLIKLAGKGEVIRVEPGAMADMFGIAVACAEPIYQIEGYLPGT